MEMPLQTKQVQKPTHLPFNVNSFAENKLTLKHNELSEALIPSCSPLNAL